MEFVNEGELYLPGAASLLEQLDKIVLIILRDGKHLVGTLRSVDQYLNIILENTCERIILTGKYCDIPIGLYIVRGDNIVLIGDLDSNEQVDNFVKIEPQELITMSESNSEKVVWDFD